MTENSESHLDCPNCHNEVRIRNQASIQISHAMRLRFDTLGTQVNCPHCRQPFLLRARQVDPFGETLEIPQGR
ncbi:MAG: hypothetical protein AB7O26_12665 [Planctomycetaceae bacterium]